MKFETKPRWNLVCGNLVWTAILVWFLKSGRPVLGLDEPGLYKYNECVVIQYDVLCYWWLALPVLCYWWLALPVFCYWWLVLRWLSLLSIHQPTVNSVLYMERNWVGIYHHLCDAPNYQCIKATQSHQLWPVIIPGYTTRSNILQLALFPLWVTWSYSLMWGLCSSSTHTPEMDTVEWYYLQRSLTPWWYPRQ